VRGSPNARRLLPNATLPFRCVPPPRSTWHQPAPFLPATHPELPLSSSGRGGGGWRAAEDRTAASPADASGELRAILPGQTRTGKAATGYADSLHEGLRAARDGDVASLRRLVATGWQWWREVRSRMRQRGAPEGQREQRSSAGQQADAANPLRLDPPLARRGVWPGSGVPTRAQLLHPRTTRLATLPPAAPSPKLPSGDESANANAEGRGGGAGGSERRHGGALGGRRRARGLSALPARGLRHHPTGRQCAPWGPQPRPASRACACPLDARVGRGGRRQSEKAAPNRVSIWGLIRLRSGLLHLAVSEIFSPPLLELFDPLLNPVEC
jgi:hypothetical protein